MNTKNNQNTTKNQRQEGECKPLPLTYLFARYVNAEGKPVGAYAPVINTVFFSYSKLPIKQDNGLFVKNEQLVAWSTNEYGVIKQLGHNFTLGCDIRQLERTKSQKFFLPPMDALSFIFAAHGENWVNEAVSLLEGMEPEELTRANISFKDILEPRPDAEVPKEEKETENKYRDWHNQQKINDNNTLHGFEIHKTRALILTFSNPLFEGSVVNIWPHGSEYNPDIRQTVAKPEGSELLIAIFTGSVDDLPVGLYNIMISNIDFTKSRDEAWNGLVKSTEGHSYRLKEKLRFDIKNLAGDFEIINCDPITVEEAMLQQFPLQYSHLIENATKLASASKLPEADSKDRVPQGFQGFVHHLTIAKSKAELVAGILGADDPSKKFWAYGQALSIASAYDEKLKKTVDLMFQVKGFKDKLNALQEAREAAAKAKGVFTESVDVAADFHVNKASGLADDAAQSAKATSMASKFKIPERYLTRFSKYMGVVGHGLTINALGVAVSSYVQVSKQAKENSKHMDEVAIDYHRQVHEMVLPKEGENTNDISSFLYYNKFGKLQQEQKAPPEKNKRLVLNVTFDVDKYLVKPEFAHCIDEVVAFMQQHPNSVTLIEGHTDSTHSYSYNMKLSLNRAIAVQELLINKGIDKKRVPVVGYGETRLIKENGDENKDKSRRVVAVLEHKTMLPSYAASREGMTNMEKMRAATVADELALDDGVKDMASKGLDVAVGVLAVLPVPGSRVAAAVIVAAQAGVEVAKSAASWADETFLNSYFTSLNNNRKMLQGFNEAAHANQKLMKPQLENLAKDAVPNSVQELETTEQQAGDYLNAQFRLRAEAIYGLIGLMTRAANKTNDVAEYRTFLEQYKVKQYIQNFVLNDQWIFPLRSVFPISLDEYWLYAINEMGFMDNKPNMGFGLDKDGKWVALEPSAYETFLDEFYNLVGAAKDVAINPLLGAIHIAKFINNYFSNTVKAEFQKIFPVHHFSSDEFYNFADVFKPNYTELDNHNIYEHTAIYWRRRGYYKDSDWQPLEQKLNSDEPELSPFDQIRVLIVLKKELVDAENKNHGIYPIRIQLSRTDGFDINGPVYKGLTRPLSKGQLLANEYDFADGGYHGAVIYPFFQFGLHTMPGIKPMASETTMGALGLATDNAAQWYYRLNGLDNMRYVFEVTVGRLEKGKRKNRTTRPVRTMGKDELYNLSEALDVKSASTFASEFRVTLDIDKLHEVPDITMDASTNPSSSKGPYNEDQIQAVRDEALLLNKDFLTSRVKDSIYPTLFMADDFDKPRVKIMMRLGGKGKYIFPHPKFSDVLNWGAYKSQYGLNLKDDNKLVVNKFDWETPVEFIVMVVSPNIDKQAYLDMGYDWRRIPLHMDMIEATGVDTLGPPIDVSLEYVGTMNRKPQAHQIIDFEDSGVDDRAISKELLPLRELLRKENEHALGLCAFPFALSDKKLQRHFYAAHIRMSYQSLTGENIDSIRPFGRNLAYFSGYVGSLISDNVGTRVKSNGKGNGEPFRYGFTNIKSRGSSGIDEDADFKETEFIFPEPLSYVGDAPWIRLPTKQEDPSPLLTDWLEKAQNDEQEKIKRVNQWVEEDTRSLKQPVIYQAIKD